MANSPDISLLSAYAGKYEKALFSKLFNTFDALNDLTLYQDVKTDLIMTKLRAGSGARPHSATFEPTGADLIYTNNTLSVKLGKRDISIEPGKYRSTWMSEVQKPGVNPLDIPFAKYMWEQVMIELAAELNDETIYFGFDKANAVVWDSGDTYTANTDYVTFSNGTTTDYYLCISNTSAAQSPTTHPAKWQNVNARAICLGFKQRIATAVTNSLVTVETTGAITNTTAVAQFDSMWRQMPVAYRNRGANIYCSYTSFDALVDDYENRVGKYTQGDNDILYLPKTGRKCQIIPATWMGSSGRLIATPKNNMIIGTDRISDIEKINTEPHMRTIDAGIDFALGTVVRDWDAMVVNDQA